MIDGTMMDPNAGAYLTLSQMWSDATDPAAIEALDTAMMALLFKINSRDLQMLTTLWCFLRMVGSLAEGDRPSYRARVTLLHRNVGRC